jgi:pSer/pThr/pTyr-binding forkhead associated (FHA) protein
MVLVKEVEGMQVQDMPMLFVKEGELSGQEWVLDRELMTIGRGSDCDILLPERAVSRHHARIERRNQGYFLLDLGSKNGTHVNGQEVKEPYLLQDGDEIQVALSVKLSFVGAEATVPLSLEGTVGSAVRIDKGTRRVWVRGQELDPPLSPAQYRLLELLLDADGQVVSREDVVSAVWPEDLEEGISEQAIDALVRRLRDRLAELAPEQQYIVTVRGHGFRLENA